MRVLIQEVVLDRPGMIDADPIGQLNLFDRFLDQS
jgi:hypothetical protein